MAIPLEPLDKLFDRLVAARQRLSGHAHLTPVVTSRTLDDFVGANVFLKCENFQRVGAFKFRGAFNAISSLSAAQREAGVVSYSSGNHAQAVALAGHLLGVATTIVMPHNAPQPKRAATEAYGATVVEYDPDEESRREVAEQLANKSGAAIVPPYDHLDIIAGQGTAAAELHEQTPGLDLLVVPCGGGGLLSGCAIATRKLAPDCRLVGIEPEVADDATRSFRTGKLHTVHNPPTIADGTRTPSLGELNFRIVRELVDDMRTVSEAAIKEAVVFLLQRTKLVVEPSGALGVAALLSGAVEPGRRTGVILSGGNIDPPVLAEILGSA